MLYQLTLLKCTIGNTAGLCSEHNIWHTKIFTIYNYSKIELHYLYFKIFYGIFHYVWINILNTYEDYL